MNSSNPPADPVAQVLNRRGFLRRALATGAGAALIPAALNLSADAQTAGLEAADEQDYYVLNFALMLEYLEAQFYNLAVKGKTLEQLGVATSGFGTQGEVIYKSSSTLVPFADHSPIAQYAAEITADETNHVKFLRLAMVNAKLTPAAQPTINLVDSFNTIAQAAEIGSAFDPFASPVDFLIGGFAFEDVGVTAYHGAAGLLTSKTYLAAAAGILAVEGYHASLLRTKIFEAGKTAQGLAAKVSALRGKLGGGKDQGVLSSVGDANIVPTDAHGVAFARTVRQVMNIVFGAPGADQGLFFPNGMNLPAL